MNLILILLQQFVTFLILTQKKEHLAPDTTYNLIIFIVSFLD